MGDGRGERQSDFEVACRIGEGTFGEVLQARNVDTGETVALKRLRLRSLDDGLPNNVLREIHALEQLHHPNVRASAHGLGSCRDRGASQIVRLLSVFPSDSTLVIAMEYGGIDLYELLSRRKTPLPAAAAKAVLRAVLRALAHCHARSLIHRDVKSSNVLVSDSGRVVLADFGLARVFEAHPPACVVTSPVGEPDSTRTDSSRGPPRCAGGVYTHEVATRWYRAPELLLGAQHYGSGVDLWAVGVLATELLTGQPLFRGVNDIDQLMCIVDVLGAPLHGNAWPAAREHDGPLPAELSRAAESDQEVVELPDYGKLVFHDAGPRPWAEVLGGIPPAALDFISRLLVLRPADRPSAVRALAHAWFFEEPLPCPEESELWRLIAEEP